MSGRAGAEVCPPKPMVVSEVGNFGTPRFRELESWLWVCRMADPPRDEPSGQRNTVNRTTPPLTRASVIGRGLPSTQPTQTTDGAHSGATYYTFVGDPLATPRRTQAGRSPTAV